MAAQLLIAVAIQMVGSQIVAETAQTHLAGVELKVVVGIVQRLLLLSNLVLAQLLAHLTASHLPA